LFFINFVKALESEVTVQVGYAVTNFIGTTCPNCLVYFREGSVTYGTALANSVGNFTKSIEFLPDGNRSVVMFSVDSATRRGGNITQDFTLVDDSEITFANIYLLPTVDYGSTAYSFSTYHIYGSSVPGSTVSVEYVGTGKFVVATAGVDGIWNADILTDDMALGNYSFRIKSEKGLASSGWSAGYNFVLISTPVAPTPTPTPILTPGPTSTPGISMVPTGKSGFVRPVPTLTISNITIKSWTEAWEAYNFFAEQGIVVDLKYLSICDLNFDKKCDIRDFSILMYRLK